MSSSTTPNGCPGLRVSGSPGPSSSATSTKSTSPTCERGWQGSSRQDKRGSNYLRTKRFVNSFSLVYSVLLPSAECSNRAVLVRSDVQTSTTVCGRCCHGCCQTKRFQYT